MTNDLGTRAFFLLLVAVAGMLSASTPASAQMDEVEGLRGDMIRDVTQLEGKYVSLAEAMPASTWNWRPMEGVRSVGELYCHVAGANFRIPGFFGVEQPGDAVEVEALCADTDPVSNREGAIEALRRSFTFAREAVAAVPDERLGDATKLFGRDTTNRAAMLLYVTHMHEHLGQAVAYARSNGVVPPWSAGG
jgi:uncharacterized damage-inducible protein DinB